MSKAVLSYAAAAANANAKNGASAPQQPAAGAAAPAAAAAASTSSTAAAAAAAASNSAAAPAAAFKYTLPPPSNSGDMAYLPMLEPAVVKAVSVPFAAIAGSKGNDETGEFPVHAPLRQALAKYGFAIVTDVLNAADIKRMEQLFANDLLSIVVPNPNSGKPAAAGDSELLRSIKSDPLRNWPTDLLPLGTKFASDWGLPQATAAFAARTHPNMKKAFAAIHGTHDLVSGLDNVFFNNKVAPDDEPDGARLNAIWGHADQNMQNKSIGGGDHDCYQGVLYIWPAGDKSQTTVVWPESHTKVYPALMASQDWSRRGHFCRLQKRDVPAFVAGARRVPVPAGALLLWSSKTIHQGTNPLGPRLAFPVCMQPRMICHPSAQAVRSQKMDFIVRGTPSTHWAACAFQHSFGTENPNRTLVCGVDSSIMLAHRAHWQLFGGKNPLERNRPALPEAVMEIL